MQKCENGLVELSDPEAAAHRLVEILLDSGVSLVDAVIDVRFNTGVGGDEFWCWVLGVEDIHGAGGLPEHSRVPHPSTRHRELRTR